MLYSFTERFSYILITTKEEYIWLKQASYNWSELLKAGLLQLNFKHNIVDPYLYYKENIICTIYEDDIMFWCPAGSKIDQTSSAIKGLQFDLTDEGDVDSFLGIEIDTKDDGAITMSQPGLIDTISQTLGL